MKGIRIQKLQHYRYSPEQNYIKDNNNKINGTDTSNKKNFSDNLIKLNPFNILNGEEEFNENKNNNIMQFIKDLNHYINQYIISIFLYSYYELNIMIFLLSLSFNCFR